MCHSRDYGATRGFANESEFTVVKVCQSSSCNVITKPWKVDFYNNIKSYLSELENTEIRSLEDIVQ